MSYRQCRNLCEMLRSLNYNRIISLQNFSKPNFELVADILYWLSQKYDPNSDISDDINEQKDRVEFMKGIVNLFAVKARIKLNPKKLYQADGEAVTEIIKITSVLYKASNSKGIQEEEAAAFTLPVKVSNLKAHKTLSIQICELGAKLYDAMSREPDLRKVRGQALSFLQGMNGVSDGNDQAYIETSIKTIMQQQDQNTRQMAKYVGNMEHQQKLLEQKLKKKSAELERAEKRYKNLVTVKPAFMEEYEKIQQQFAQLQETYASKYRNLDYLEYELELYNKIEDQKLKKTKKALEKMREKALRQQQNLIKGNHELIDVLDAEDEDRTFTRGNSRKEQSGFKGNPRHLQEDQDDSDQEEGEGDQIDDDEEDEGDDDSDF